MVAHQGPRPVVVVVERRVLNSSGVGVDGATKGHEFAFGARSFVTYSFVS